MKTFLKRIDKIRVYDAFYVFSKKENFLEYDLITRHKMHDIILNRFKEDPSLIGEAVSFETLKLLKERALEIKKQGYFLLPKQFFILHYINQGLFLVDKFDEENLHATMSSEVVDYLVNLKLDDALKERADYITFLFGTLEVYGIMLIEDLDVLYEKVRPKAYKLYPPIKHASFTFINDALLSENYRVYQDGFTHPICDDFNVKVSAHLTKKIFDYDTYLSFGKKKMHGDFYYYDKDITLSSRKASLYEDNINIFMQPIEFDVLNQKLPLLVSRLGEEMVYTWPLWKLGGLSLQEMMKVNENLH